MVRIVLGVLISFHGLVHLLYFGHSARYFELQPGLLWPNGSWAFSRLLGDGPTRMLASTLLALVAIGFLAAGAGMLFRQAWSRPLVVAVAALSSVVYLLFWDGVLQNLDGKGWVGILINAAILAAVLVFQLPRMGELANQ
jgi:hypothetical protein